MSDDEPLDKLVDEAVELQIEKLNKHVRFAFSCVAQQSPKPASKFLDGLARGYALFMDEEAKFCGDRGRTEIYMALLVSEYEIEKMRRTLPERTDKDLLDYLKPWYKFPTSEEKARKWLRDVCDDICLYVKGGPGRPHKLLRPRNAS